MKTVLILAVLLSIGSAIFGERGQARRDSRRGKFKSRIEGLEQSVSYTVTGKLMCGTTPIIGAKLALSEFAAKKSSRNYAETTSNGIGTFTVTAKTTTKKLEWHPLLTIGHSCDSTKGEQKVHVELPKSYVVVGTNTSRTFDLGVLNLEAVFRATSAH